MKNSSETTFNAIFRRVRGILLFIFIALIDSLYQNVQTRKIKFGTQPCIVGRIQYLREKIC